MTATVRVVLEYLHPWTNSTGFFVASQQGWYREAGLDVELSVVDPQRGDSLEYLSRHETTFAVFPTNRLLVRRSRHEPLIAVAAVNHRAMETIHTLRSTGIERPRDLEGRRISFNPTPRGVALVRHLVAVDGGDPERIVVVDSGLREYGAAEIAVGEVDATFGNYWAWDVLISPVPPEQQLYWPVDEIGAPRYHSYLLGTQESTLVRNPGLVETFLAITARGFRTAASEQSLGLQALEAYIPYWPRPLLAQSLARVSSTWLHDGVWGEHREELHEPYAEWLASVGIIPDPHVWREATTNALLPTDSVLGVS